MTVYRIPWICVLMSLKPIITEVEEQVEQLFVGRFDLRPLLAELDGMLRFVTSGEIWASEKFRQTPEHLRRLNTVCRCHGLPTNCAASRTSSSVASKRP